MNTPIEAVLFDYGLVLSGPPDPAAWARMRRITGHDEPTLQAAYWAPRHDYDRGTHSGRAFWRLVGSQTGLLTEDQIDALIEADTDLWTQPNQPMIDWAARLQVAGIRTGILSNIGDEMELGVRARMPWLEAFHHHTFSHNLKIAKPEAEIYAYAAKGMAVPPASILFVDDRAENIAAAIASGMQAIQYTDHERFLKELADRGLSHLWTP